MQIYVEPSIFTVENIGDNAMLQVAVRRLASLWPGATIFVPTRDPTGVKQYCPEATPIPYAGYWLWHRDGYLFGRLHHWLPRVAAQRIVEIERGVRCTQPRLARAVQHARLIARSGARDDLDRFFHAVTQADLLLVSGMGKINDVFGSGVRSVLETAKLALDRGIPAVAVGQGLGPLDEGSEACEVARSLLPRFHLIALREPRSGPALLRRLGVNGERIMITGDDAVELAYNHRQDELGESIGVNLRPAWYANLTGDIIGVLRGALRQVAGTIGVSMLPLAIAHKTSYSDVALLRVLTNGVPVVTPPEFQTLDGFLTVLGSCRLVITGSYHAGVFALLQGISVVALAASRYYVDKFEGLREMFGSGCTVLIRGRDALSQDGLTNLLIQKWGEAPEYRAQLLEAARKQIALSRAAYWRIAALV